MVKELSLVKSMPKPGHGQHSSQKLSVPIYPNNYYVVTKRDTNPLREWWVRRFKNKCMFGT